MDNVEMSRSRGDMRVAARAALALEGGLKAQLRRVRRLKAVLAMSDAELRLGGSALGVSMVESTRKDCGTCPDHIACHTSEKMPHDPGPGCPLEPAPLPANLGVPGATFRFSDTEYCVGGDMTGMQIEVTYRRDGCDLESAWTTRTLFAISLARTHGSPRVIAAINGLTEDPARAESDWDFVVEARPSRHEAMFHVAMTWLERRPDVTAALGLK